MNDEKKKLRRKKKKVRNDNNKKFDDFNDVVDEIKTVAMVFHLTFIVPWYTQINDS